MKRGFGILLLAMAVPTIGFGQEANGERAAMKSFRVSPSYFIPNQRHAKTGSALIEYGNVIAFVQTQQGRVLFTPSGAYIGMAVPAGDPIEPLEHPACKMDPVERGRDLTRPMKAVVMKVGFDAQRAKKRNIFPSLKDKTDHIVNFSVGSQENWRTGLPSYRTLVYENVWDGIDLEYVGYKDLGGFS